MAFAFVVFAQCIQFAFAVGVDGKRDAFPNLAFLSIVENSGCLNIRSDLFANGDVSYMLAENARFALGVMVRFKSSKLSTASHR